MATASLNLTSTDTAAVAIFHNHDSAEIAVKRFKADAFLVIVHGTASEVQRARTILQKAQPELISMHGNIDMHPYAANLVASR